MKTYFPKPEEVKQNWYVVNAEGVPLGRLAARIAAVLRGKTKSTFTPHVDVGDFVIVLNAEKVMLTGNKLDDKMYYRHTGFPGGLKGANARTMLAKKPEEMIKITVRGMLPKNAIGRKTLKKLKVYRGNEHPHQAQQPQPLEQGGRSA
jgi:large subunit ribosomal protein L13